VQFFVGVIALTVAVVTPLGAARAVLGGIVTLIAPEPQQTSSPAAPNVKTT
jgi:predicted phage tail protein